jgi:L,D-transpeptidase catalytic domain
MRAQRRILLSTGLVLVSASILPVRAAATGGTACPAVLGTTAVSGPTHAVAWRVAIEASTAVFSSPPGKSMHITRWLTPTDAAWLMVIAHARAAHGRCWVEVRLPWRPNASAGWINADKVVLGRTLWRIVVSTSRRTLTLFRAGNAVRTVSVVVGKPGTPTPDGLFAVWWAVPWHPDDFLGSWVLDLTAHSDAL